MPAVIDTHGRAAPLRAKPKRKVTYAPQTKATKRPSSSRAATLVPGVGAVTRPTPRMKQAARTVAKAAPAPKPRTPRKPTAAERAAAQGRQRVRQIQASTERKAEPARKKSEARAGAVSVPGLGAALTAPKRSKASYWKGPIQRQFLSGKKPEIKAEKTADDKGAKKTVRLGPGVAAHRASFFPGGGRGEEIVKNAPADAMDLLTGVPTSAVHVAKTAVTEPKKLPKMLAQPYIDVAKHPIKELTERPVSTLLTVVPVGRVPGLAAGKVARKTGKQTLERTPSTLPGTTLKNRRIGSRAYWKRKEQERKDKREGSPVMRRGEVQRRVDEFYDYSRHRIAQARDTAAARAKAQGLTGEDAKARIDAAGDGADRLMQIEFAREFGANARPSVGHRERQAAEATRKQAKTRKNQAREAEATASAATKAAQAADRAARSAPNPRLAALEAERAAEVRALAETRLAHSRAQVEQAKAHGGARVSVARTKVNEGTKTAGRSLRELQEKRAKVEKETDRKPIEQARREVSEADRHVTRVQRGDNERVRYVQAQVKDAEKRVDQLEAQLRREEETASRLEGESIGRYRSGKVTRSAAASRQKDKIGALTDELTDAKRAADAARETLRATHEGEIGTARAGAQAAREKLKTAERETRATTRAKVAAVNELIAAEHRRVSGVAPREADRLLAAIAGVEEGAAGVGARRQSVRDLTEQIAEEQARARSANVGPSGATQNALRARAQARADLAARAGEHSTAKRAHIDIKGQAAHAALSDAAKQGRLFEHRPDANKVRDRLNEAGHSVQVRKGESTPLEFHVIDAGDRFAVVPKMASTRLMKQQKVGTSKAWLAKGARTSRRMFTQATLPLSPKWLFGQASEAGIRSAIAGAGPVDLIRINRVVDRMNELNPGSGDRLMTRLSGGQFGMTGAAREFTGAKTLREEFADTPFERAGDLATSFGETAIGRLGKEGWSRYTKLVLGKINGVIEANARKAMAGHAAKEFFNEKRINALSEKAIDDAARGLMGTDAQVALAREVDAMYGKYQKFSPATREALLHWTPFLPWYLNTAKFLGQTLPRDHPFKTSLLVAANTATDEWRQTQGLSMRGPHPDDFLMGGYPIGGGVSRVGHYTPWGVTDIPQAVGALALPQLSTPLFGNLGYGVDWTGNRLRHGDSGLPFSKKEKAARAAMSLGEAQIPGLSQLGRISGLTKRYIDKRNPETIPPLRERLLRELPLWPSTSGTSGAAPAGGGYEGIDVPPVDLPAIDVPAVDLG